MRTALIWRELSGAIAQILNEDLKLYIQGGATFKILFYKKGNKDKASFLDSIVADHFHE